MIPLEEAKTPHTNSQSSSTEICRLTLIPCSKESSASALTTEPCICPEAANDYAAEPPRRRTTTMRSTVRAACPSRGAKRVGNKSNSPVLPYTNSTRAGQIDIFKHTMYEPFVVKTLE